MLLPEGLNPGSYTPFTDENRLNQKLLAEELKRVTPGSSALHGPAGHSEFASLTIEEWKGWTDVLIDVAHGAKLQAWSFLGAESFEKAIPFAQYALDKGADGLFLIAPYFNLYSQEAGYEFYRDFAAEFPDTPIVFYPSHQTGNHFEPGTIAKIAEIPNIVGMKLAPENTYWEVMRTLLLTKNIPNFRVMTGGLNILYPFLMGWDIKSSCSGLSNFDHKTSLAFWNAYLAKDWPTVERLNEKLTRIEYALKTGESRHVGGRTGHKAGLEVLGRYFGPPRRPGFRASDEHRARIRKVFAEEGLL